MCLQLFHAYCHHTPSFCINVCSFVCVNCVICFYVPHGAVFMTEHMVVFNKSMLKWTELMFRGSYKMALSGFNSKEGKIQLHLHQHFP